MQEVRYPLRHVSIRVPWHDNFWNGTVCQQPRLNTACLKLKGIANSKDEIQEEQLKGRSIAELLESGHQLPPCVKERATFMAPFAYIRQAEHPYTKTNSDTHGHFRPTMVRHPAYSAAGVPFLWLMKSVVFGDDKENTGGLVDDFPLEGVSQDYEPELSFQTNWVQDHRNHQALLECFWNHVQPEESLVFFYAKQAPLVEDTGRRVLIGVGRVKQKSDFSEYNYEGSPSGKLRSLLWECMVTHSIRPDFCDGFLLPYHEALEKSDEGRAFNPAEVVAFAPEDRFVEFSYATEHVSHDAAISALLSIRDSLQRCSELFDYHSGPSEEWIDRELGRLWKKRGPFPGLGAVLTATGVTMGNFIAQSLVDAVGESADPWAAWFEALKDPDATLPPELGRHLDQTIAKSWLRMSQDRLDFLKLLSRMDLSQNQAKALVTPEERAEYRIRFSDADVLTNPYLVYETTRLTEAPVSIGVVDRGLFPNAQTREKFPIPEPTRVKTAVDARRLRALTVRALEAAAGNGSTLRARKDVIRDLRQLDHDPDEQKTAVTGDLLQVAEEELFAGVIDVVKLANDDPAYQLQRFTETGKLIRSTIEKRIEAKRHEIKIDWRAALDAFLNKNQSPSSQEPEEQAREELARVEKTAALEELVTSRFSVLIGKAGTGKTTLLSVLCSQDEIRKAGVLLLAPTGKARVRMADVAHRAGITEFEALTLAQHLSRSKRYDGKLQRYLLTGERGEAVARTVIVDESSMLTEEMLAALVESLSKVDRLIFVGDYRQLPPIGAGRPFIDIVARLQPAAFEADKPRVSRGYAELTIPRRQETGQRDDLLLASWFGGGDTSAGDDQVFEILTGKRKSETVEFVTWETPDQLQELLPGVLHDTLKFDPEIDEDLAFGLTLGGNLVNGSVWYGAENKEKKWAGSGIAAEAWQILSPVRQKPWGVDALNRFIHSRYKQKQLAEVHKLPWHRSIPTPKGDQQIVYGDKVINVQNWPVKKKRMYPAPEKPGYLANGEVGVVIGHRKMRSRNWIPRHLEVEFSTQRGTTFTFWDSDFKDEGEAKLELAYALTVHKAQGSEFETVFLVLPRSPLMVTRELLYTALTRQRKKVVVLLQGTATDLHRFSSERYSESARRLTNLFGPPNPIKVQDVFLEERLIHHTSRGELVRSKSEVIIANLLHAKGVDYDYEQELVLNGSPTNKFPDFTIEDDDTGQTYYWEHLGMLGDREYRQRWEEKLAWYRAQGIQPHAEGVGENGTLIITQDDTRGGIDSGQINGLIDDLFSF